MDILILISLDVLFLLLLTIILTLDRRIGRIKRTCTRFTECMNGKLRGLSDDIAALETRLDKLGLEELSAQAPDGEEGLKAHLAEKRFTEGIASILSYGLDAKLGGKEGKR